MGGDVNDNHQLDINWTIQSIHVVCGRRYN